MKKIRGNFEILNNKIKSLGQIEKKLFYIYEK